MATNWATMSSPRMHMPPRWGRVIGHGRHRWRGHRVLASGLSRWRSGVQLLEVVGLCPGGNLVNEIVRKRHYQGSPGRRCRLLHCARFGGAWITTGPPCDWKRHRHVRVCFGWPGQQGMSMESNMWLRLQAVVKNADFSSAC